MTGGAFFLGLGEAGWQVARIAGEQVELREVTTDQPTDPAGVEAAAAALRELGCGGEGVCLALPADMVLAAEIDCDNLPRKQRRTAMVFRLEEQLPLDAERLTADFLPPLAGKSLGLAVQTRSVQQLIDRLAEAGVETYCICPLALLAAWELCQAEDNPGDYVILCDDAGVDVLRIVHRQPAAWYRLPLSASAKGLPAEAEELVRCVSADLLANPAGSERPTATVLGQLEPEIAKALENEAELELAARAEDRPVLAAARTAGAVLAGRKAGWVDFRKDRLAAPDPWGRVGGLVRSAVCLAILLPAVLAGLLYWRGVRYDAMAGQYRAAQIAKFEELYPNQKLPGIVRKRLQSELKRLSALSRPGGEMPDRPCSLESLRRIVTSLPASLRLRIVEIRIDPAGIFVEGQARDHSAAEMVAQSLRRSGFDADSPRSEHLVRGGVAFTIIGRHGKPEHLANKPGGDK